ncbi:hypothetical protein HK099_007310 [Clydaea vesicula]|uniref:DNA methylase N-4/N-6 domain-containing protein n=1 Tax=Clydaea vesicula TaxID=447962 RepID=A0AAD5U7Z1_9FUNG|nr:hypothetical protein HK099_007310 [Clydaea vesicula]
MLIIGINSSRLKFVNLPKIDTATMNIPEKKNSTQKLRKEGSGLSEKENEVGNVVEVLWASKTYYPAVVIEAKCSEVKVHYLGWDIKFDEWIGMNSIRFKFNEKNENILNNENYELEKKLIKKRIKTKRDSEEVEEVYSEDDTDTKKYFCNDCKSQIKKYTYNCFYCSYYLCVNCFQTNYKYHKHPKTSFSMRRVFNKKIRDSVTSKEIELKFVKDNFFLHFNENDTENLTKFAFFNIGSFKKSLQYEKICGFCNTDSTSFSQFFKFPLVIKSEYNDIDEITKLVWVHIYCAKYSPEVVYFDHLNEWFNIFEAVKRASKIKCFNCKGRGASIECTKKPLSHWENGVVFWCPEHEDGFTISFLKELNKERTWYTCQPCSLTYYSTYDLCHKCFGRNSEITHTHSLDSFIETDISARTQAKNEIDNETLLEVSKIYEKRDQFQRKNKCWYCHTDFSIKWNKFEGVLLCYDCSEIPLISSNKKANCNIFVNEDESKLGTRYLTRKMMNTSAELGDSAPQLLKDYGPDDDKLFSCVIDNLKGRATKWANHSSMDYSGTWLPHLVRWAIIRYSKKNDLILSNFLGRGTDIIESFILERRSVGVDINPRAVKLAQKNLYFKLPLDKKHNIPSLFLGNSTNLKELGDVFSNENFDLILSHPPYKDCIKYSEDIIGDLSLLSEMEEFLVEIDSVAQESNRLLKDGGRCFFGMGDNRKKKIYQAISFESILKYLGRGFEIEEFIVKRLRHTAAGGLGSYFSTTYDILMFHHEFLVVFKKKIHCPNETSVLEANCMKILTRSDKTIDIPVKKELRILPKKPLKEPCGMGTVWNFSSKTDLPIMAMARILERFGSEGEIWEQVDLKEFELQLMKYIVADEMCTEREELGEVIHVRNGEYSLEARRIESSKENEKMLNDLGLSYNTLTDLGQEKLFLQKILNEKQKINSNEQMKVHLKFIPHLNFASTSIFNNTTWIKNYQNFIKNEAIEFLNNVKNYERFNAKLEEYRFIVGVKDVRGYEDEELLMEIEKEENAAIIDIENIQNFNKKIGEKQFKFFPMSVLIYKELMSLKLDLKEIIQRKTLSFKFKELLIVVPDGYEKVRIDIEELKLRSMENDLEFKNERNGGRLRALPIVHAFYFVFAPEERTVC